MPVLNVVWPPPVRPVATERCAQDLWVEILLPAIRPQFAAPLNERLDAEDSDTTWIPDERIGVIVNSSAGVASRAVIATADQMLDYFGFSLPCSRPAVPCRAWEWRGIATAAVQRLGALADLAIVGVIMSVDLVVGVG